jgi:hypothetical protein
MIMNLDPMFRNPGADDPRVLILMVAILLSIIGFVWIRSITSLDEEKPSSWRYLRATDDADALVKSFVRDPAVAKAPPQPPDPRDLIDAAFAQSWRRARRGRMIARLIFALDLIAGPILFIAAPNFGAATYINDLGPTYSVFLLVGVAVPWLIGLAWMWRILRADPDPNTPAWRYRER